MFEVTEKSKPCAERIFDKTKKQTGDQTTFTARVKFCETRDGIQF